MPNADGHFVDPFALSKHEIAEITAACKTLPGDWYVDPVIDHRRTGAPRVWVHPTAWNREFRLSFGFSKDDGVFFVAIQLHDNSDHLPTEGLPLGRALQAAVAFWRGSLTIIMNRKGKQALEERVKSGRPAAAKRE
jgi:hypothetical protein